MPLASSLDSDGFENGDQRVQLSFLTNCGISSSRMARKSGASITASKNAGSTPASTTRLRRHAAEDLGAARAGRIAGDRFPRNSGEDTAHVWTSV